MSGFDPGWLALREPVDHRSRARTVQAALAARFAGRDELRIVDLGCGSGSNLRGTAAFLSQRQSWTLVDADAALLQAARERLAGWADRCSTEGEELHLAKGDRRIAVRFVEADLSGPDLVFPSLAPDLVTSAALFDLVSENWLTRLAEAARTLRLPVHTTMTYNGAVSWLPGRPEDGAVRELFNGHQRSDKGLGPALGPDAPDAFARLFTARGYTVIEGESPWELGPDDAPLLDALHDGFAGAVGETGGMPGEQLARWRDAKPHAGQIGHVDSLALPPA